jgi:glycosyltransferase involved in cell wall biosynthesis
MGAITDLDRLAPIYIASDVYVYPGLVGLGPLQAMCYDLPIITIDADSHKPEIEYLSLKNSIILPNSTNPEIYAQALINLFQDTDRLNKLKTGIWSSIKHLTIEEMARNFILGVNLALNK